MKVLVLTDHRGHTEHNSLYALLSQMVVHPSCTSVHVASRGLSINHSFFYEDVNNTLYARKVHAPFSFDPSGRQFEEQIEKVVPDHFEVIFLRLPRPISDEYLSSLELTFPKVKFVNRPSGIIRTSNKKFLLECSEVCPPIALCHSKEEVENFAQQFSIVLKPLKEYGGRGLLKIEDGQVDNGQEVTSWESYYPEMKDELEKSGFLAMKYLKNVTQGDKRIIVVDGKIMASSLRIPKEGSWLCNIAQGGYSTSSNADEREMEIVKSIEGKMRSNGILIYGVDTLVDDDGGRVLSEINTLSIGGFPQAEEQTGRPIIQETLDLFFAYANKD